MQSDDDEVSVCVRQQVFNDSVFCLSDMVIWFHGGCVEIVDVDDYKHV